MTSPQTSLALYFYDPLLQLPPNPLHSSIVAQCSGNSYFYLYAVKAYICNNFPSTEGMASEVAPSCSEQAGLAPPPKVKKLWTMKPMPLPIMEAILKNRGEFS